VGVVGELHEAFALELGVRLLDRGRRSAGGHRGLLRAASGESEALDAVADEPYPEFVEVEFDDEAMAEAYAEIAMEEDIDLSPDEDDHIGG
jgi:hypothetical protein